MKYQRNFQIFSYTGFLNLILPVMLLFFLSACGMASSSQRIGGPCTYKQYQGEAEIVSVKLRQQTTGEYEIRFAFHPQKKIQEVFARVEGKQWLLVQEDSSFPKKDFLQQYDIKTGKRFPCYMNVITRGTCTPVLFDFPSIRNGRAQ
ncbi:MAG TPA: hypothetical protein PKJ10_06200 [Smithella sp.]|nr:hypothetical protein [Smithella sp.]